MEVIPLFVGFDPREAVGSAVFEQSVFEQCRVTPVAVTRLSCSTKGNDRDGTNKFTYQRFLVPHLMGYKGHAIFVDGADMLLRADLHALWEMRSIYHAVQVVKQEYIPKHPVKYVGTDMETLNVSYPRKNWSSVVLWNCGHYQNRVLSPSYLASQPGELLHRFGWVSDDRIGALPREWNVLIGENDEGIDAHLAHYTLGIPGFRSYRGSRYSDEWFDTLARATRGVQGGFLPKL